MAEYKMSREMAKELTKNTGLKTPGDIIKYINQAFGLSVKVTKLRLV